MPPFLHFASNTSATSLAILVLRALAILFLGEVAFTCNPATLEAEFQNSLGSIPVAGNSPSIGGWIVWPLVIQHKQKNLTKYWDLCEI